MAAPGDPQTPQDPQARDDHDDLIGFTSPSSLTGSERAAPTPGASTQPQDDEIERDLFDDRPLPPIQPARDTVAAALASNFTPDPVSDTPQWARAEVRPDRPAVSSGPVPPPEGAMGLYAVYALILFAVPTLGVSAAIALLAVLTRPLPLEPLARSHCQYQKRTLVIAAVGAVLGVVLIAVNLGVFVLFALALWVLVRGTAGLVRLASGRPIANPKTLFI